MAANPAGERPYSWRLHSVMANNCRTNSFVFEGHTDLTMIDFQAIGCWSTGFKLTNCANSTLIACRAEWGYGFHFTGSWGNWSVSGLRPGARNSHVAALGKQLIKKGFGRFYEEGPGPHWTAVDRAAVRAFQLAHKELRSDADGYPGPLTWKTLFS